MLTSTILKKISILHFRRQPLVPRRLLAELLRVSYGIADGSLLDDDGIVNGVILDPVGLAVRLDNPASLAQTGVNRNAGMVFSLALCIVTLLTGVILIQNKTTVNGY